MAEDIIVTHLTPLKLRPYGAIEIRLLLLLLLLSTVAHHSSFFDPKRRYPIARETPSAGRGKKL